MKIAVLGGGHGCYAAAADLAEQGHEVRLWRRSADQFGPLLERPVLTLKDEDGAREVTIAGASTDIADALSAADLVLIPSPAVAQRDIAAEPRVVRAIHFAHPARTKRTDDRVRAELRARNEVHRTPAGRVMRGANYTTRRSSG